MLKRAVSILAFAVTFAALVAYAQSQSVKITNTQGTKSADVTAGGVAGPGNAMAVQGVVNGRAIPVSGTAAPITVTVASTPSTCTAVTTTSTLIAANASRHGFMYCGKSTNTKVGHVARGATATASQTEVLPGACWGEDNVTYQGAFSFVSDDGVTSTTICFQEW